MYLSHNVANIAHSAYPSLASNIGLQCLSMNQFIYFLADFLRSYFVAQSTLENHCTRTAQSSRIGYSRKVHRIVYLAVKKVII